MEQSTTSNTFYSETKNLKLSQTKNTKTWISPQIVDWDTDFLGLKFVGALNDGGNKTYNAG